MPWILKTLLQEAWIMDGLILSMSGLTDPLTSLGLGSGESKTVHHPTSCPKELIQRPRKAFQQYHVGQALPPIGEPSWPLQDPSNHLSRAQGSPTSSERLCSRNAWAAPKVGSRRSRPWDGRDGHGVRECQWHDGDLKEEHLHSPTTIKTLNSPPHAPAVPIAVTSGLHGREHLRQCKDLSGRSHRREVDLSGRRETSSTDLFN